MGIVSIALDLVAAAPKLITLAMDAVKSVESLFGSGNGGTKKQAAMQMISDALNIYSTVAPELGLTGAGTSDVQAALSTMIDAIVAFYNAIGVFKNAQKPALTQ